LELGTRNSSCKLAGAVKVRDEKILDTKYNVTADAGVIKAGKRFLRIQ
jgi:hypothetical protein